jgi:hypothetical protein
MYKKNCDYTRAIYRPLIFLAEQFIGVNSKFICYLEIVE